MARSGKQAAIWWGAIAGVLALTACGGGAITTATPLVTVTPSLPTTSANVAPASTATTPLALTPQVITTTAAPDANAPTPTPLVNGLLTPTSGSATSATSAMSTATTTGAATTAVTSTPGPSTPVTGSTSGTRAATTADTSGTSGTSATSTGSAASGTRAATSATTTTSTSTTSATTTVTTTRTATNAAGATTATAARDMATPAANVPARITAEQFLNAVVKKADISAYLSPALRAQSGGDGSKLLGVTGSIQMFTIDSEKAGADGTSAVVHATITTAAGTMGKDFTMQQAGGVWQIVSIS